MININNDLISRQALCEYALNQKNKSVTPNDIMRFPSAQFDIIRCRDCIYGTDCEIQSSAQADGYFFCGFGEKM